MLDWLARKFEKKRAALHDRLQQSVSAGGPLTLQKEHPNWRKLGSKALDDNNLAEAERCYLKALALAPADASAHVNLGYVKLEQKQLGEARCCVQKAIELDPENYDAWYILASIHELEQDLATAVSLYRKTFEIKQDFKLAYLSCSRLLRLDGENIAALDVVNAAISSLPEDGEFHLEAGILQLGLGQVNEAFASYERATLLAPEAPEPYVNMAAALISISAYAGAVEQCQIAIRLNPKSSLAHDNLGVALLYLDRSDEAMSAFEAALTIDANMTSAICNMGSVYIAQAKLDEAIAQYRRSLSLDPSHFGTNNNLLFALNYHPDLDAQTIYQAYEQFNEKVGVPLQKTWAPHGNSAAGNRLLRIGYVSPDFRRHSVMRFLEPVLTLHDKQSFEVYAYAEVTTMDDVTARAQIIVSHWRSTVGMTDAAIAQMIRTDQIDVLIDVAGHTSGNRLRAFAHKPAPVTVSWMGFGYTTGLPAIDYYLTDAISAPAGSEHLFAEKPWRMNRAPYVYRSDPAMGAVGTLTAKDRGYITFCTLTRPVRVNHRVVRVWAEILRRLPNARLVVDSKSYSDTATSEILIAQFVTLGIDRSRLEVGYHSPPWDLMRSVDISLDCFPHNSGTTLFESLYMGVPYITLAGRPSVGRLGATILQCVGHSEWVATSEDEYVELAVDLASDLTRLAHVRANLRTEMERSPLMDETGFTRALENTYREMFEIWESNKNNTVTESL